MDQERKRREALYYKFRRAAKRGLSLSEFDENDLIDIYDYASDYYDEDVQMHVLFTAARYFPEDDELMQRRAYFLLDNMSMNDGALMASSTHREDSALWDLLSMRVSILTDQEVADKLSDILNRYEDYDDETIIQLVNAFAEYNMLDWLKDHKDLVQKRCLYPDTFLYELASEMQEQGDHATAIRLLDELTGMAPFNATYWHMLAQEYINTDDYANALSAIDYAVALEPSNPAILTTKAQILYDMKRDVQEAYRLMRNVVKREADYKPALLTLTAMLTLDGQEEEAAAYLEKFLEAYPNDGDVVEHILKLGDSLRNLRVLRAYLPQSRLTREDWTAWARRLFDCGQWQPAADVLLTWLYAKGQCDDWNALIEALYRQRRVGEIAQLYREYLMKVDDPTTVNISFTAYVLLTLALARSGQVGVAAHMADYLLGVDVALVDSIEQRVQLIGAKTIAHAISGMLAGTEPLDIDSVDPLFVDADADVNKSDASIHDIIGDDNL